MAVKILKKNKIEEMNEILLKNGGNRSKIAKIFNVSAVTVRNALKGRTNSKLAEKIRKTAIEYGGVEVEDKNSNSKKYK